MMHFLNLASDRLRLAFSWKSVPHDSGSVCSGDDFRTATLLFPQLSKATTAAADRIRVDQPDDQVCLQFTQPLPLQAGCTGTHCTPWWRGGFTAVKVNLFVTGDVCFYLPPAARPLLYPSVITCLQECSEMMPPRSHPLSLCTTAPDKEEGSSPHKVLARRHIIFSLKFNLHWNYLYTYLEFTYCTAL